MKKFAAAAMVIALLGLCGCGERALESWTDADGETKAIEVYPMSELDIIPGPGPFLLGELAERFGEPVYLSVSPANSSVVMLTAAYERIGFELYVDGDVPWFDYKPEEADKTLPMEVHCTIVENEDFSLPRRIRIGDSLKKVRAAYPNAPYESFDDLGSTFLFYRYENTAPGKYGVTYEISAGKLVRARITWSDMWQR